jgi:ectoine hydroxylase-related dioxygenase (phytanoyl-CoA dioxygenase family)
MESRELTMASPQTSSPAVYPVKHTLTAELRQSFEDNGYLTFEGVVDTAQLAELHRKILAEFDDAKSQGKLFSGGGTVHGHLNCFPGVASRFVYETLQAGGILDIVQALSSVPLRAPNVGCNMNLPGSGAQNDHADSYTAEPFLIVNIAVVDTEVTNGAMQVLCRTHRKNSKYWQILLQRPERIRVCMKQGDVVVRTSMLWHRGMPNLSRNARPMLALTWEDGGSSLEDPYEVHGGRITFLPNRYRTDWAGRLRERAFVAAPRLATALRVVRSFL